MTELHAQRPDVLAHQLIPTVDAAAVLGVSARTVQRWLASGRITRGLRTTGGIYSYFHLVTLRAGLIRLPVIAAPGNVIHLSVAGSRVCPARSVADSWLCNDTTEPDYVTCGACRGKYAA